MGSMILTSYGFPSDDSNTIINSTTGSAEDFVVDPGSDMSYPKMFAPYFNI